RQGAEEDLARRAVDADPVAFLERQAALARTGALRAVVDDELRAPGDTWLADLAGDDGGKRGGAATRGQDPLGDGHPMEVMGRGLDPDEDDHLASADPLDRVVRVEDGPADGGARRGVQPLGDPLGALPGVRDD